MPQRTARADAGRGAVFVDSSAWLAVASASDGRHAEADALLHEAVRRRIRLLTTNLVLAEVHRLALVRMGIRPAAAFLDRVDASPLVAVVFATAEHHHAARRWLAKLADQRLSYTDGVSFAVMAAARCRTAMTFDRHFSVAGFEVWRPGRGT